MADRKSASHILGPDLTAIDAFAARPDQPAEVAGRAARALYDDIVWRLAHAELPATARTRVLAIERRAADLVIDFVRRGLPPRYFWPDFAALAQELDAIAAGAPDRRAEAAARRLVAELRKDVAAAAFPPSMRGRVQDAIAQLDDAAVAFEAGALPEPELQAIASLANAAVMDALTELDGLSPGASEARFHRLAGAALRAEPASGHRQAIAGRLQDLQTTWEAGDELPQASLDELEALLQAAPAAPVGGAKVASPSPALAGAALRLDQAVNRVASAPLPPFVTQAATSIVEHLRSLLADRAAGLVEPAAFEAAFARGLETIESCLAFAREVGAERDIAARRVETLVRRVRERVSPPLLAGLLEDELERLRALMRDLEAGRPSVLDFHRAFDDAVENVERLLAWRDAFHPHTPAD